MEEYILLSNCFLSLWGTVRARSSQGRGGSSVHPGWAGQGLSARASPTTLTRSRAAWGKWSSLRPGHQAWEWGQDRTRPWHRPTGGPGLAETHGRARQSCGELETGPDMGTLGQGLTALGAFLGYWAGTVRAGASLMAVTLWIIPED